MEPPNTQNDRAAQVNERKSHLRSIATAGTLATMGAFTYLASSATHTASTSPVVKGQAAQQVQAAINTDDDGFVTAPGDTGTDDATFGHDGFDDPSGTYFDPSQGSGSGFGSSSSGGSTISPPQMNSGPGGGAPSMSGGS